MALQAGRRQDRQDAPRLADALVGVGYFFVWTVFGMAVFPPSVALAAIEMQQPTLACAIGAVVVGAGLLLIARAAGLG